LERWSGEASAVVEGRADDAGKVRGRLGDGFVVVLAGEACHE